jgi:hypothetical protein
VLAGCVVSNGGLTVVFSIVVFAGVVWLNGGLTVVLTVVLSSISDVLSAEVWLKGGFTVVVLIDVVVRFVVFMAVVGDFDGCAVVLAIGGRLCSLHS